MVEIGENYLLTFAGMVFIPVFIFAIKMIMEVGTIKTRLDAVDNYIKDAKELFNKVLTFDGEIKSIRQEITNQVHRGEEARDRMQRDIDMLNQFSYGTKSKSSPSYLVGEEETRRHKDSAGVGLFKDPDSTRVRERRGEDYEEQEEEVEANK